MKIASKVFIVAAVLATAGLAQAQTTHRTNPSAHLPATTRSEVTTPGGASRHGAMSKVSFAPVRAGDGQTDNWRIVGVAEAERKPWTAVGNFVIPGLGGYCSAVLVAPRIVLTANHCLYAVDYNKRDANGNPGKQLMDAKRFAFAAGVHDSKYVDLVPVEEVITGGWAPGTESTAKDWAIAILARPASSEITPIAFKPYDPKAVTSSWRNKLVIAAYPGASFVFNTVLRFSFNCSIVQSVLASIVTHDCPAENGSSGGPILVDENGELTLIGIHSSSRQTYSQAKDGVSINSFYAELKSAITRVEGLQARQRQSHTESCADEGRLSEAACA